MTAWYERQLRIIHPSLGLRPGELERLDPEALAQEIAAQHYNAQHLEYSLTWDGEQRLFLFPTPEAREVPRDILGDYLPQAHRQGLHVFIYMNVHWANPVFLEEHPDWVQRLADGSPLAGVYGGSGTSLCVNTPWRDWTFGLIEDMASRYPIDGIFLDGPCFYQGTCYCQSCQDQFHRRHGTDLGAVRDESSPHWRDFMEFRYDSIARFVGDCRQALQRHRPGAPLYMNANGLHSGRLNGRHNRKLVPVQDLLGAEGGFIFYGRPADVPLWKVCGTAKFLEAQAQGKPTVIFTAAGHKPWEYPLTAPEIRLNVAGTFAGGANPWLGCYAKDLHDPSLEAVSEELAFFARHEELLSHTRGRAETALLWSHDTADYYQSHLPEIDFMVSRPEAASQLDFQASFSGAYESLVRTGTPFVIVDDAGVREEAALEGMRTLLLADVACMDEPTAAAIRQFVHSGGQLVATNNTSLFDPSGRPRPDFLLADVFGASFVEPRGLSQWELIHLEPQMRQTYGLGREDLPSPSYQVRVRAHPQAQVMARYYQPTASRYSPQPPLSEDPAALLNRFGRGTCLYLAGNWAHHYWTYRIAEYQTLLTAPARLQPWVSVEAASSAVEVTLREDRLTGDYHIHLLNYTGEMERPIKRVLPLADVQVTLRSERDPASIRALRADSYLQWQREQDYVRFVLPKLGHHEVIHVAWK